MQGKPFACVCGDSSVCLQLGARGRGGGAGGMQGIRSGRGGRAPGELPSCCCINLLKEPSSARAAHTGQQCAGGGQTCALAAQPIGAESEIRWF